MTYYGTIIVISKLIMEDEVVRAFFPVICLVLKAMEKVAIEAKNDKCENETATGEFIIYLIIYIL